MELTSEIRTIWPGMELGEEINSGSYGQVYSAIWNGTEYAVKVILLRLTQSEYAGQPHIRHLLDEDTDNLQDDPLYEYLNEVRILGKLRRNPHIVRVEDSALLKLENRTACALLILMKKLETCTDYICQRKITENMVRDIGIHICLALEECERLSIIHRDIKPSNILIDKENNFQLADFGQAKVLEKSAGFLSVQGTDSYMAPEVNNRKYYDHRADIYSLGIVLYFLMNNRRLPFMDSKESIDFKRQKEIAIARRLDGEQLPPPCNASKKTAAVILKACSYVPEDRFLTARAFRTALETGELPPEITEEQTSVDQSSTSKYDFKKDKHTIRPIVLYLLTALILTAAGMLYYKIITPTGGNAETILALEEAGLTDHAIDFTDATLETVIREKAGKETGDVMLSDLWNWNSFSCCQPYEGARDTDLSYIDESLWGKPVTDLSCLQELTNLTALYLSGNSPRDLSRLQNLDALETLDLRGCTLESLVGIQDISNLTTLNLANVKGLEQEDFQVLSDMKQLKRLNLQNTGITDLSFLQGMESLEEVDLRGDSIQDYAAADRLGIKYITD